MARKVKIPNHLKKRLSRTESSRKIESKPKKKYFLLICEGEKTEPHYFESIKNALPKGVLELYEFDIDGTGYNTESLVKKGIILRKSLETSLVRKIDKLWIIFDRDSFTPKAFNNAIQICLNNYPGVEAAWTNEAFELWYLLHFHFYNTAISRTQYQDLIEANFRKRGIKNYKYKKNSSEMFSLLETYGNRADAIKNATTLEKQYNQGKDFSKHNPCTTVHKLVAELFDLNKEL